MADVLHTHGSNLKIMKKINAKRMTDSKLGIKILLNGTSKIKFLRFK